MIRGRNRGSIRNSRARAATPTDTNGDGKIGAGDTLSYRFTVENSGNTPLEDLTISDPKLGERVTCTALEGTRLVPGATADCGPVAYTMTQDDADGGDVDNTATVTATDPVTGDSVTDTDGATATVAPTPSVELDKTVTPDATTGQAGDTVTYRFHVTNTGNVTLTGPAVDEARFTGTGTEPAPVCATGPDGIAPGTSIDCTATYTLTQADVDAGTVENTATVTGTAPDGTDVTSDPSEATVTITAAPAIAITKTADVASYRAAGDTVTYTLTVVNSGNVTLTDPTVNDTAFTGTGPLGTVECPVTTVLAPGASFDCTVDYTLTQADVDAGTVSNTATATGTDPNGTDTTSEPSEVTITSAAVGAISLTKTGAAVDDNGDGSQTTVTASAGL